MNGCEGTVLDLLWSFIGLVVGTGLGFGLGYNTGKKRTLRER